MNDSIIEPGRFDFPVAGVASAGGVDTLQALLEAAMRPLAATALDQPQLGYGEIHRRMLLEHGPASLLVDSDSNIVHMSGRAAHFLRFAGGEPSHNLLSLVVPELRLALRTALYEAQQTGCADPRRITLARDGAVYDVTIAIHRASAGGGDSRLLLVLLDEALKSPAGPQARVGDERMRLVAESTRDYAIMTMDADGNFTSWNKGAERIFGWTEAEALGMTGAIVYTPEDRDRGAHDEEMQRAIRDGRAEDERWHIRKDGSRFYCSGVMTPLTNRGLYGFAKIARDQTARVQQGSKREEALSQEQVSRWNAETNSALKDEFLAIMSHELRHPLNLIHINVELLARLPAVKESPVANRAAAAIRSSVISQAKIIEDLLDLSRLNTGKLTLALAPLNFCELVSTIAESAQSAAADAGVQIAIDVPQHALIVLADPVRLEQVIRNLLNNAEKFTPSGGSIRVRAGLEGEAVRLDVIDDGIGIAPSQLSGVFEMFSQAGCITNRSKKGLGIGLALVRQIIDLHQGRVEAVSEGIGKGARFSVWLPSAENARNAQGGLVPALAQSVGGLRILIVDDSEDMNFSLKALLELEGATVFVAENAAEGLALLQREKVDLLISDISMPKMNGYEFIEKVREMNIAIPAIAASGLCRDPCNRRKRAVSRAGYRAQPAFWIFGAHRQANVLRAADGSHFQPAAGTQQIGCAGLTWRRERTQAFPARVLGPLARVKVNLHEATINLRSIATGTSAQRTEGNLRRVLVATPFALDTLLNTPRQPSADTLCHALAQSLRLAVFDELGL